MTVEKQETVCKPSIIKLRTVRVTVVTEESTYILHTKAFPTMQKSARRRVGPETHYSLLV